VINARSWTRDLIAPAESPPDPLVLHAVRLLGLADGHRVAARYGLDPTQHRMLPYVEGYGWICKVDFPSSPARAGGR
jgi:hypothetical protein